MFCRYDKIEVIIACYITNDTSSLQYQHLCTQKLINLNCENEAVIAILFFYITCSYIVVTMLFAESEEFQEVEVKQLQEAFKKWELNERKGLLNN